MGAFNRITFGDAVKINEWLKSKKHEIEGGVYLRADLLAAMCKHLGKEFGDTSLSTALKQSGIVAKYRHPMAGKPSGRAGQKHDSKVAKLERRLAAVEEFLKSNGFTMPETN
jgi:hypothetical protein